MKRYIYIFFMLMCIVSCEKPEEGMMPEKSVNANIVRFRIYPVSYTHLTLPTN